MRDESWLVNLTRHALTKWSADVKHTASPIELRGEDPMTLEVFVGDLMRRSFGQVAPITVADLLALCEVETLPHSLKSRLRGYVERTTVAIRDLPKGTSFLQFMEGIQAQGVERVSQGLRDLLQAELDRGARSGSDAEAIEALLSAGADVAPEPFTMSQGSVRVQKVAGKEYQGQKLRVSGGRGLMPADRGAKASGEKKPRAAKASGEPKAPRAPKAPEVPEALMAQVRQIVYDRLAGKGSGGLSEAVLVAGTMHRCRGAWPNMTQRQVKLVLKSMAEAGQVRHSAGRWMMAGRGW